MTWWWLVQIEGKAGTAFVGNSGILVFETSQFPKLARWARLDSVLHSSSVSVQLYTID